MQRRLDFEFTGLSIDLIIYLQYAFRVMSISDQNVGLGQAFDTHDQSYNT